jgi:hypothetical protein
MCSAPILGVSANILWELKHKVDDTIKKPESASRIGVVIKWHVLELSILRQEFIFEFH